MLTVPLVPGMGDVNAKSRQPYGRNDNSMLNRSHGVTANGAASSAGRRIVDATSEKELMKAMSTYLNTTGAADYNLPAMTGAKVTVSGKKNLPSWGMQSRTKLSWFPGRGVDFAGSASPPATLYAKQRDAAYPQQKYSIQKQKRFYQPSSVTKVREQVPHQYTTIQPGLVTGNQSNYDFNRVGMGYGSRSDFTNSKMLRSVPGAKYDFHE